MATGPIQVVLNSADFISAWIKPPGGGHKDFYEGRDEEFIAHKNKISEQLTSLEQSLTSNEFSEIAYAKVVLKKSAIAKSHRPTGSLFKHDVAPVVGAGDLGELFVEVVPSSLKKINNKILQAEETTRYKITKDEKRKANPSAVRSELGAIEEILPYTSSDKRNFSLKEAVKWITDPRTGGAYIIELFEVPPPRQDWDNLPAAKYKLFRSFFDGLNALGNGIVVSRLVDTDKHISMLGLRVESDTTASNIQFMPIQSSIKKQNFIPSVSHDLDKHTRVIAFLDRHPLVKKIVLPPIISKSITTKSVGSLGSKANLPKLLPNKSYPKIGIVDGGVSDVLKEWIEARSGLLSSGDKDEAHGTFIAGLTIIGNSLNGNEICNELDGCKIIDVDLLPKDNVFGSYYHNPLQFFSALEDEVKSLKAQTGVRVFNFSLNIEEHVSSTTYSYPAKILDKIAEENNVIFVISAGNTHPNDLRQEWPDDASNALSILATSRNDIIKTPAESSRNVSVSALNPPNLKGIVPYALSNYSCRGPGPRVGLKPDFAHVGGTGTKVQGIGHGLYSIDINGNLIDGCGTSYATPITAKTIACIEHAIEGEVSRESLIALAVHHATLPAVFQDKRLSNVVKHLVGYGMPVGSQQILNGNDNSITLVFANRVKSNNKMSFSFSWPQSLVKNGKCFGHARLTIVSTPPFDHRYGAEFVRVNVDGFLRQEQDDGTYKGRLNSIYLPAGAEQQLYEKNQIDYSFKWSPVKVFEKTFSRGVGSSSNWKLEIEHLTRDGDTMPVAGVPFTAILTISDPNKKEPVFQDMRQSLQSLGVKIADIKIASRITPRV
ncbi:MAG: hypothetical protein RL007_2244 [Bacteroidota bacterium]|jgi:hypothetical protein